MACECEGQGIKSGAQFVDPWPVGVWAENFKQCELKIECVHTAAENLKV